MKLIMAYVVVAIHTTDWSLMGLTETAVPYFFIASGFFLFRKLGGSREEDLAVIRQWTLKILKLYLIWTAIYLPFTVVGYYQEGLPITKALLGFVRNVVFVGSNYFSWSLWYLLGMVWAGICIYIMRMMNFTLWAMIILAFGLYLSEFFFDFHSIPYYSKVFATTRNGFFVGLPFITAGGLAYYLYNSIQPKKAIIWDSLLTILSFIGFQYHPLFLPPLALGIFFLSLRVALPHLQEGIAIRLGSMSKTIFLVHMVFVGIYTLLSFPDIEWSAFLFAAILSTLLSWGLGFVKGKDLSWIR